MKKIFILLSITVTLIPTCATYAQSDPYERHIDSLFRSGLHEEAYQYAKQRWQSLSPDKSQLYKDATADYYGTAYMLEMIYRHQEKFEEALKLNEEMLALKKAETDYFAICNKIVCYSGLGNYAKAAKSRALLYKAYKKHKLPCERELCHYYNFDYFRIDTLNIWGYEWYDELPKNRFSTSFTKVVYYVYSTNPDGSDKDQLYRLHLIMFHGTDVPFDYIMEKHVSTKNGESRQSMYKYTYKEKIDYEKLHNDVKEIVKGSKKTDSKQNVRYKAIEDFIPDTVCISAETVEAREKTEYVAVKPYEEYDTEWDFIISSSYKYDHLNISLNGTVKSVVQTEVLKHGNQVIGIEQQTWNFSPNGHLFMCQVWKIYPKDSLIHNLNDARPLSKEDYDTVMAFYVFDGSGLLRQVTEKFFSNDFEYDQNGHLIKILTYLPRFDRLRETLITLNEKGRPVRVEEFDYKDEMKSRKSPSDLGPSGKKSVGDVDCYYYYYDERGNMVSHQMKNGKSAKWRGYYMYDSLDNMIFNGRCTGYKGENTTCKCKGFHASQGYEYDNRHNMIREYSIGDWRPRGWDNYYQYDSAGREIEYKHYSVRGEQRTFDSHIQTTYDSAGRIVRKEALLGSFLVNETIFHYTREAILEEWAYDEYGNMEQHVVYETKDKPFKIVRWQYTYDQHGNWVKRVCFEGTSDDSMSATEVLERKIEYYE